MLIASSSQMPARHGQPQREPDERAAPASTSRAVFSGCVGLAARGQPAARTEELGLARAAEVPPQ